MASKKKTSKPRNTGNKTGATGFATNRKRVNRIGKVMAGVLILVMVVFMLISSSAYLFN